jgi:hypothetical protein
MLIDDDSVALRLLGGRNELRSQFKPDIGGRPLDLATTEETPCGRSDGTNRLMHAYEHGPTAETRENSQHQ